MSVPFISGRDYHIGVQCHLYDICIVALTNGQKAVMMTNSLLVFNSRRTNMIVCNVINIMYSIIDARY